MVALERLKQIRDLGDFGILPKTLQSVEVARFGLEYMHKHVTVVNCHPQAVLKAHHSLVALFGVFLDVVGQVVGNAVNVCRRGALANYEVLEGSFLDFAHIYHLDVAGLTILQSLHDSVD